MLKRKILVVDDEQDIREIIRFYLEDSGYEVIEAENGQDALNKAKENMPELITLDIIMPGMDGFEVIKRLKEDKETQNIPVIILSVVPENYKYHQAIADYISKPFERGSLIDAVEKIFSKLEAKGLHKILIVDDEKDIVDIIESALKDSGYLTIKAYNGKDALEQVKKELPDLIILDLGMPLMNGYEVIKQLKSQEMLANIPIVVLTGTYISEDDRKKGINLGADKYLTKPFSAKDLAGQIKEMLKGRNRR